MSNSLPSDITDALKRIEEGQEKVVLHTSEKNNSSIRWRLASSILEKLILPIIIFYVIGRLIFLRPDLFFWISSPITSLISLLAGLFETRGLILWVFTFEAYLGILIAYSLLVVYSWFFILPLLFLFKEPEKVLDTSLKILSKMAVVFFFLLLPLIITNLYGATFGDEEGSTEFQDETRSFWSRMSQGPLCFLINDPNTCVNRMNSVQQEESSRTSYSIRASSGADNRYFYSEILGLEVPIGYEILSRGDPIEIISLSCYIDSVSPSNLLSFREINQEFRFDNVRREVFHCDLSDIEIKDREFEVSIISVLNYKINTIYTMEIPVVNEMAYRSIYGLSSENYFTLLDRIEREFGKGRIISSNSALSSSFYVNRGRIPILLGGEREEERIDVSFVIERGNEAGYGNMVRSELFEIDDSGLRFLDFGGLSSGLGEEILLPLVMDSLSNSNVFRFFLTPSGDMPSSVANEILTFKIGSELSKRDTRRFIILDPDFYIRKLRDVDEASLELNQRYESILLRAREVGVSTSGIDSSKVEYDLAIENLRNEAQKTSPNRNLISTLEVNVANRLREFERNYSLLEEAIGLARRDLEESSSQVPEPGEPGREEDNEERENEELPAQNSDSELESEFGISA